MIYIPYIPAQFPHIASTEDCVLTAPTGIEIRNKTNHNSYEMISWDPPTCDVDFYTLYFTTIDREQCQNTTLNHTATEYRYDGLKEIQIVAHLNDMTNCSEGMY